MWGIAFKSLLFGSSLLVGFLLRRQRLQEWRAAAELSGLQDVEVSGWTLKVRARAGQTEVRFEGSGDKQRPTRIVISAPGPPGFHEVSIRSQSVLELAREIEIGDEHFDDAFVIQGPAPLVSALLDAEMRALLTSLTNECELQLSSGELRAHLVDEMAPVLLPCLVELRQRLAQPLDIPRRLAENARQDPRPGVRLHNLLVMIRELPKDPGTAWALRDACSDRVPKIRLRAAKEMGAEGRGVLLDLAKDLKNDVVSAEAVSALDRELPFEKTTAILKRALIRRRLRTAIACLESIGRRGGDAAVGVLADVLERKGGEVAVAAARALGATGSQAAEPPLLHLLQSDQEDLRMAAVNALGRVGSAASVPPLKEAAERSLLDLELRRATRQAIAEIQSRVEGASPGQLSLAGAEAGQLSLAQAEAGQLSLTEDPAGQLSLGDEP